MPYMEPMGIRTMMVIFKKHVFMRPAIVSVFAMLFKNEFQLDFDVQNTSKYHFQCQLNDTSFFQN